MKSFKRELWKNPAVDYSQCPFWFWNDDLDEKEIVRQLDDFQAHGVNAFVIHPRIGLPSSIQWLSEKLFYFMRFAVEEARKRGMWVILYDEGMYPSGSSAGMVVDRNPAYHVRGLTCRTSHERSPEKDSYPKVEIARMKRHSGEEVIIYDQPVDSVVRGLHYLGPDPELAYQEEEHIAADLLNPEAVQCFIELVYERFHSELGEYFGSTIKAIFTDEPHPLGRVRTEGAIPGTTGIMDHVKRFLGYDFTPHLPCLWFDDEPDAEKYRRDYDEAIAHRLNETYYRPLYEWCEKHHIPLTGHPADPDDFGHLKYFQFPGQDIVWRHIEPHQPSALEGPPSTMAKAAASAAFHDGRRRNLNEFAGAFGKNLTFFELKWLSFWLLIRGCNLLAPHAFYYSMRGPRGDERPPDVGPNSSWWAEYLPWATATKRLCWLNAEFQPVCQVAILGRATTLPWDAAKICFENQIDFHYLDEKDLADSSVGDGILHFKKGRYSMVLTEENEAGMVPEGTSLICGFSREHLPSLRKKIPEVIVLDEPAPNLRLRHLSNGHDIALILLFNEGRETIYRKIEFKMEGTISKLDLWSGEDSPWEPEEGLHLESSEWAIFLIES